MSAFYINGRPFNFPSGGNYQTITVQGDGVYVDGRRMDGTNFEKEDKRNPIQLSFVGCNFAKLEVKRCRLDGDMTFTDCEVKNVASDSGSIKVCGDISGDAKTMSGSIRCEGNIDGNAKTMSGSVNAHTVCGSATTMSGSVNYQKKTKKSKKNKERPSATTGVSSAKTSHIPPAPNPAPVAVQTCATQGNSVSYNHAKRGAAGSNATYIKLAGDKQANVSHTPSNDDSDTSTVTRAFGSNRVKGDVIIGNKIVNSK